MELFSQEVADKNYDYKRLITVYFLLSNDKSSDKAKNLFKFHSQVQKNSMSKSKLKRFFIFIFDSVAIYSLVFSELSTEKIIKLNNKIKENVSKYKLYVNFLIFLILILDYCRS